MKHKTILKLLCALVMALLVLTGAALAEESEVQQAELRLFTAGSIPQPMRMRTVTPMGFDEYIAQQLRARAEKIYVLDYAMSPDALVLALSNVINDNPDLFYIGAQISYTTGNTSGNVYNFFPQYLYTGDDLTARIAAFDATVDELAAYARSVSSTQVGQMLALNDYFCVHYEYDDALKIYAPDQFFLQGSGVCQAYMLAYAAVLDELGIANTHATSYSMNHTWNMVELDGDWYHVDVTWNDPDNSTLQTGYSYFLLSDEGMLASDHYEWSASYVAANTAYDAFFWREMRTPMAIDGSTVYFVDVEVSDAGLRTIRSWNVGSQTTDAVHTFSITDHDGGYFYATGYGPISIAGGKIYYAARENLFRITPGAEDRDLLYACTAEDRYIWSLWVEDGMLQLLTGDSNRGSASIVSMRVGSAENVLTVPASVQAIGDEAFTGISANQVVLPDGVKTIGEGAFAACSQLYIVNIPAGVTAIADSAFDGCTNLTLTVQAGSYGESYAAARGIHYVVE